MKKLFCFMLLCLIVAYGAGLSDAHDAKAFPRLVASTMPSMVVIDVYAKHSVQAPSGQMVDVLVMEGLGSGVAVGGDRSGTALVLTCHHVIEDAAKIEVECTSGIFQGEVIYDNPKADLAIVAIMTNVRLKAITIANKLPTLGDDDFVIGDPFGVGLSVTRGIVSGFDRGPEARHWIQTDASVNPGNSGGGMFNMTGELEGIVVALASNPMGASGGGVGFAVPLSEIKLAVAAGEEAWKVAAANRWLQHL